MQLERQRLLGGRLRAARYQAKLSQKYVEELMQLAGGELQHWEVGEVAQPSATQLAELATIYGECAHFLLFGAHFRLELIDSK